LIGDKNVFLLAGARGREYNFSDELDFDVLELGPVFDDAEEMNHYRSFDI
jgi:hypothetical protein